MLQWPRRCVCQEGGIFAPRRKKRAEKRLKLTVEKSRLIHKHIAKAMALFYATLPKEEAADDEEAPVPPVHEKLSELLVDALVRPRHIRVAHRGKERCGACWAPWFSWLQSQPCPSFAPGFRPHVAWVCGEVVLCDLCGAFAQVHSKLLLKACAGYPSNNAAKDRLVRMRGGLHPTSSSEGEVHIPAPLLPSEWLMDLELDMPRI